MSESILLEAERIIHGARRDDYGDVRESFARVADLWSAYLGIEIQPEQVGLCMVLLKIARAANVVTRDSLVDIAGYAGCVAELIEP